MTANVALTDSFDQWRVKTNEVVVMTQTDGMSNFIKVLDTTNSTSNTTGSIITAGGLGVLKSAVIGENLRIHGNVITDGDTTISGNLVFGDADTDQVTFSADINSSLVPNVNNSFNIGNTTMIWANTYTGHLGITQKTDSGIVALDITSQDVDKESVRITASQSTANVFHINAHSLTTGTGITVLADALTTGSALAINSNAPAGTRNLFKITNDNTLAVGATALSIQSDAGRGLFIDSNLAAGGYALEIDAELTTTNTAKIAAISTSGTTLEVSSVGVLTGKVIDITADAATTGTGINMSMDGLTTGSALAIDSDSASTGTRNIASIIQNHASASGSTTLYLQNDHATANALKVVGGVQVGVDNTGHDVKFFGATSGKYMEWDEGSDELDVAGNFQVTGPSQLYGTFAVGVDGTGHDVKFFGDSAGAFMIYDQSADNLEVRGPSADATTSTGKLLLSTALTDINDGDVIGRIDFKAPLEAGGTDAILAGASMWAEADATFSATVNSTDLVFATGASDTATEKMRLTHEGYLGIGLEEPQCPIHVSMIGLADGLVEMLRLYPQTGLNDGPYISLATGAGESRIGTVRLALGGSRNGTDMRFMVRTEPDVSSTFTAATSDVITTPSAHGLIVNDKIRFTTSGADLPAGLAIDTDYYVKTVPATTTMTVSASQTWSGGEWIPGGVVDITDTGSGTHTLTQKQTLIDAMRIASTGNIGIGTVTPSTKLHVVGTITETSMREIKTNISNMENMLPAVLQMQGVKFDFRDSNNGINNYGFIAEDVDKILPNVVSHDEEGKPEGIQYTKMTAVLLEAIKEQQVQIDELKSKILN